MAPDGSLVLIELKRGRTPREVVAQALDYASWVEELQPDEIAAIYHSYAPGRSLAGDFESDSVDRWWMRNSTPTMSS